MLFETTIIGNLGQDAQVKSNNGRAFISFTIAHTDRFKNQDGTTRDETTWVSVAKDGDGGNLTQYLTKGSIVCCQGKIRATISQDGRSIYYNMSNPRITLIQSSRDRQAQNNAQASGYNNNDPFAPNNGGGVPY